MNDREVLEQTIHIKRSDQSFGTILIAETVKGFAEGSMSAVHIEVEIFSQQPAEESSEVNELLLRDLVLISPIVCHRKKHFFKSFGTAATLISTVNEMLFDFVAVELSRVVERRDPRTHPVSRIGLGILIAE
jgi:cellobiose-specific phosphotransferase system component IIB